MPPEARRQEAAPNSDANTCESWAPSQRSPRHCWSEWPRRQRPWSRRRCGRPRRRRHAGRRTRPWQRRRRRRSRGARWPSLQRHGLPRGCVWRDRRGAEQALRSIRPLQARPAAKPHAWRWRPVHSRSRCPAQAPTLPRAADGTWTAQVSIFAGPRRGLHASHRHDREAVSKTRPRAMQRLHPPGAAGWRWGLHFARFRRQRAGDSGGSVPRGFAVVQATQRTRGQAGCL
jgi:hypothetical protein